jgi:MoxR-like ATPase
LPGDIIGTNLFDFQTNRFTLTRGPVFTEVLLADEINRTPPKTQAALLEAMQERSVTVDGHTHPLARDSSCSRRRTRSSTKAPTRCPRPSSTASCSSS